MSHDADKIDAVRGVLEAGAAMSLKVNSRRGWSPTAQRELERILRRHLTTILGRRPTPEEIAAAGGDSG